MNANSSDPGAEPAGRRVRASTGSAAAAGGVRGHRPGVERVLVAFDVFQRRLMSVHAVELAALELTMAQAKLMYLVVAEDGLSLSGIAGRLGIGLSTASGAVDRLVDLGMLTRETVPTNRRQVNVSATRSGIETIEQFHELGARQMRAFLANVPDAELDLVERAVGILANAIPAAPESPGAGPGNQRSVT